jgi:hypothetical protein
VFNDINLYNPDFIIDCSKLKYCKDIYTSMRDNGIVKAYVYGMCFKPGPLVYDFLKVGMSCPNLGEKREYQVGERITRQLSWVPGWSGEHVRSSHGADFWLGIEHFLIPKNLLPKTFNKNDVTIAVWNISKRIPSSNICEDDDIRAAGWAEGELARQYKEAFGRLPHLNIQDPSNAKFYKNPYIPKSVWDQFTVG